MANSPVKFFSQAPVSPVTVPQSEVYVHSGNGYGSVQTSVRRFSTIGVNVGSDITYTDSASNGATFLINADGIYSISYCDSLNGNVFYGPSLNGVTTADFIAAVQGGNSSNSPSSSVTLVLSAGDIIYPLADGTVQTANLDLMKFRITRVGSVG